LSCDVAILGGGITGALAAYHLTREGLHTVMLDRRPVGGGSTTASTGCSSTSWTLCSST